MKVEFIFSDGIKEVHFVGTQSDYTLCGFSMDGVDFGNGVKFRNGSYEISLTDKKVTCKQCIKIVKYCKKLRID
jgi:hypothetical protein